MLAKNKRPPVIPANVQATRLAYEWVTKSIVLREIGRATQANAAEQKARNWLKKAIALENMVARSPRIGVRA